MRYTQQPPEQRDRRNDDYDRYRNYDDIEDADYERYGHGRSGGRGGMGRNYSEEDRDMRSTGDGQAIHDREFERDYDRKFDRDSGYPARRPHPSWLSRQPR